MGFKDDELTLDELMNVKAGIEKGDIEGTLNKMSKEELTQFKGAITQGKELSIEELDNVKAGMPHEMVETLKEENKDLFIK